MMQLQNTRTAVLVASAAAATNADSTGYVDTKGFSEAQVSAVLGVAANATNIPTTLKLSESDDTEATNFSDFLVGGTTDGFKATAVSASTSIIVRANLDLRKRKRYIKGTFRAGTGTQLITMVAVLGKAKDSTLARASGAQASVDL